MSINHSRIKLGRHAGKTAYTKGLKEEQERVMSVIMQEVKAFKDMEADGWSYDGEKYTEGLAYWYYSPVGVTEVTVMHTMKTPLYPEGRWVLAVVTMDGELDYDNTIVPAMINLNQKGE